MTTYLELQEKVARALSDESNQTFPVQVVKDILTAAWAEVGRYFPRPFQEDITPVADTLSYTLLTDDFADGNDDMRIASVELWDSTTTPETPLRFIEPAYTHPMGHAYSQVGWRRRGGDLVLPYKVEAIIDPAKHVIKVWGYAPFALLSADDDVVPFTAEKEEFVLLVARIEALLRLTGNRVLFKQWQTRSNNTDVTMASLLNDLNLAQEDWRAKRRSAGGPSEGW